MIPMSCTQWSSEAVSRNPRTVAATIPAGVWHALRSVGSEDVLFINMPTRAYDYADPDKLRLPLVNDLIPFRFK